VEGALTQHVAADECDDPLTCEGSTDSTGYLDLDVCTEYFEVSRVYILLGRRMRGGRYLNDIYNRKLHLLGDRIVDAGGGRAGVDQRPSRLRRR